MNLFQTLVFAIIQGLTELFPISSVAHGVFTPYLFHWNLTQEFLKQNFLSYVVMLHLGTAVALLVYFRKEWIELIGSLFDLKKKESRRLLLLVIVGTIPAALIGLVLEKKLTSIFSSVLSASIFLIVNGFLLYFGEKSRRHGRKDINDLSFSQALLIGLFQSLGLVPGFSRSGSSMVAGFWMGLKHESAARFSMFLALPIILGANLLEIPKILHAHTPGLLKMSLLGGVLSGIFAYISVWLLMKLFKKSEFTALRPFAWYCWIVGLVFLVSTFV